MIGAVPPGYAEPSPIEAHDDQTNDQQNKQCRYNSHYIPLYSHAGGDVRNENTPLPKESSNPHARQIIRYNLGVWYLPKSHGAATGQSVRAKLSETD